MSAICVIQARMGSTRLPGKVLADLGGRPALGFMLTRLRGLEVDAIVVATSALARDDVVAQVATDFGAEVVRGPETDVLARFALAVHRYPTDDAIRLTADCPLTDPAIVADVLALHRRVGADYTCNVLPRTFPKGLDVEVAATPALLSAHAEAADPAEREHVMPFLYRHPERFRLANLRSGHALGDRWWTIDTAEDLASIQAIVRAVDDPDQVGWRDLVAVAVEVVPPAGVLRLRPAEMGDAPALLLWRNAPDAVANSVSGQAVAPEEHLHWLTNRLSDPGTRIWIGEIDGVSVGMVRIDVNAALGEVSIAVAPDRRGEGIGTRLLELLQRELAGDLQVVALEAQVHPGNIASVRAFERVGFTRVGSHGEFDVLRWTTMSFEDQGVR